MCVEKDKLEMLVNDNPNYFFDILPYAYVLGVSDIWSKKFESIAIAPPTWYVGTMYSPATGSGRSPSETSSVHLSHSVPA